MGSSQSIPSTSEITDAPLNVSNVKEYTASTKNGPKTKTMDQTNPISVTIEEESIADDASIVSAESDYSSDEEEADEYLAERRKILEEARQLREVAEYYYHPESPVASSMGAQARCFFTRYSAPVAEDDDEEQQREQILADAKNLKEVAEWYLSPEKPVAVDASAFGRNYFTRASAPEQEEEEERERILEEMKQLKTVAEWYMMPEKPVAVDATACGRNYFSRPSAPAMEEEEERELILEEMKELKMTAEWYMHPEKPVKVDATACGRNFFSRPSAAETEEEEERQLILEEMKQLKTTAEWYMHPEKPVAVDSTACGRNYFDRPSADEYEDDEEVDLEERDRILEEMKQLKTTAEWYLCPEKPVLVDATLFGRNYFDRPSAPVNEEEEERERILEEMKELKTTATWYMHPEKPVTADANACGRNYFSRPSAPEYDEEDMEERERILEEMKELKKTAEWYLCPEKPVSVDSTACGRNFFSRPSAPVNEEEEEREQILAEMKELKMTADWYMHPEKPVAVDSTACGRNYFSRPSAEEEEDEDMDEEREQILAEMKQLKMTAEWYMHPEKPVAVDSTACGRNYFSRPSAFDDDAGAVAWEDSAEGQKLSLDFESNYTEEMEEERKLILAEMNQLKEVADWYMHPEKPVAVDSTSFGRNYFSRASAPEQEDVEDIEERELILAEVNELRMVAEWYQHPEKEVTVYATATGRNYFTRPSAPVEEDSEEREQILADAAELLRVAQWYMHPEEPVTVYATACGRNYFSRPSAEEEEDEEMDEERELILEEMKQLKTTAEWYMHPEKPVAVDATACGRNYFSRPSASEYEEDSEERDQVLADAKELKEVAGWYANPEQPVKSDGFASARSYFSRPSAPEQEDDDDDRLQVIAEAKQLKEVASWYLEPEKPVAVDSTSFGRNYFTRPSAPEQEDDDDEHVQIIAEAKELKKLAVDYLHPEKPVERSSVNCARNYFDRPSATGHADHIHTEGFSNHSELHGDYVQHGWDHHADYDHHYDQHDLHHHDCDVSQQSFHSHGDHFDMDEDLSGFREGFTAFHDKVVGVHDPEHIPVIKEEDGGKEGNLSRSPSSIMLFDEQAAV